MFDRARSRVVGSRVRQTHRPAPDHRLTGAGGGSRIASPWQAGRPDRIRGASMRRLAGDRIGYRGGPDVGHAFAPRAGRHGSRPG
ncbi:MAG: hypothetical protein AVDCRST_MAG33-2084 [uncultured Thermomicrobiales bacterium]|uniref:Uncharacterized protein n=1 Tax=uncultured Thermomicrobiales bacterium TaxID=1645740 RepID=A0A6J4V5V7_9BACT|nr:MAG: hypothetical protein AVDCRST_MAG33-2084 [uncultured Thermomicrobiales bacterium]